MADTFYARTDRAIYALNKRAIQRFKNAQKQAGISGFDELTVLNIGKALYEDLAQDNREIFEELAREQYQSVEPHGNTPPDLSWLLALLLAYNLVLHVVYENEVTRKRDYTIEAVNSSTKKIAEFKKGLLKWSRFTGWFSVEVADAATLKAYTDSGVEKVRWVSEHDNRVCGTCEERDGKVYPVDKIPPKPHPNCRCHFEPVID